jgi:hypothetical protein
MATGVAQTNSISINLTNVSTVADSNISLFQAPSSSSINTSSTENFIETTIPNNVFLPSPKGFEIFQVSLGIYIPLLAFQPSITREQLNSALIAVTGYEWSFVITESSTVYSAKSPTSDYSIIRRVFTFEEYPINTTTVQKNTTVVVSTPGIPYSQLSLYLNQNVYGYLFTSCYIEANSIDQINQSIELKDIEANNHQTIVPASVRLSPYDKQLIVPNVTLNHIVNQNELNYTVLAGQSCRFVFNYIKGTYKSVNKIIQEYQNIPQVLAENQPETKKVEKKSIFYLFGR